MIKKLLTVMVACLFVMPGASTLAAPHLDIVSGKEWVGSSVEQKRAYLFGVGNLLQIERAMAGDGYKDRGDTSIVHVLLDGLSGVSLDNILAQLDKYYADNPGQNKRAVIEVLYLELAQPNL